MRQTKTEMVRGAIISECGQYRYTLTRIWDTQLPVLSICGHNPSTADAQKDDLTANKLVGFAGRAGYGGYVLGNLAAFRATVPGDLLSTPDPIGPENDRYLMSLLGRGKPVLCCWGNVEFLEPQATHFLELAAHFLAIPMCLGLTRLMHPRHPSRLAYSYQMQEYRHDPN